MVDFTTLHPFDFDRNLFNFLCAVEPWKVEEDRVVLGRHGSDSLCRVERENKMAATYNVLAFKR